MKKIITCAAILILVVNSFCQQTSFTPTLSSAEYLSKSRIQKTFGFLLLSGGVTTLAIASKGNVDFGTLDMMVIAGGAATLGSIPLFIAAGKNKKRAINTSAFLKFETNKLLNQSVMKLQAFPAISFKFNL